MAKVAAKAVVERVVATEVAVMAVERGRRRWRR